MKSFFFLLTAAVVMALAVWAYRQNYETQARLREVNTLRSEIADLRERAGVLRAEWAYLNRPERLADLPLRPEHFGRIDEIPYPVRDVQDVMAREEFE